MIPPVLFAALACVAVTFGGGVLNLPHAFATVGVSVALPMLVYGFFSTWYTAWQLFRLAEELVLNEDGVVEEETSDASLMPNSENQPLLSVPQSPTVKETAARSNPYAKIPYIRLAELVTGSFWVAQFVRICIVGTLLGADIVFLIIVTNNIKALVDSPDTSLSIQLTVICVSAGALLFSPFFGSKKESEIFVVAAVLMTFAGLVISLPLMIVQRPQMDDVPPTPPFQFSTFFEACGAVMFSFAGHSAFPTYHALMGTEHHQFDKSILWAYMYMGVLMTPFVVTVASLYGTTVKDNVVLSLPPSALAAVANVGFTMHCFTALSVLVLPLSDMIKFEAERIMGPLQTERVRWVFPLSVQAVGAFVAVTAFDRFSIFLSLIGTTTGGMLTFVLPPAFFIFHTRKAPWTGSMTVHRLVSLVVILLGLGTTILSVLSIFGLF